MDLKVKGPVQMPTKTKDQYKSNTCEENSKTWDRFQIRIHKQLTDLYSTSEDC